MMFMERILTIYHGSIKIIESPLYGFGRKNNDFGLGFYCTLDNELAKEWAVSPFEDGYSNCYKIDTEYLKILDLTDSKYSILNWIAVLVEHRLFSLNNPIASKARQYLIDNFSLNVNAYDIIIGYRADDSYFDYAEAFLNNTITVLQLAKAMNLGHLGKQIVIKSKYAFSLLKYQGYEDADRKKYLIKRKYRNDKANEEYLKIIEETADDLYISDIIKGGIKDGDARIPRNVCK